MNYDVVIIGGGLSGITAGTILQKEGLRTVAISSGRSIRKPEYENYRKSGGELLIGDTVTGGEFDADSLKLVRTEKLEPIPIEAKWFILSTGKYTSGGLIAGKDTVKEKILDLETAYDKDRGNWFNEDFYEPQPFMSFGVRVNENFHPFKYNTAIGNLFVCGEIMEGVDGSREDSEKSIIESAEAVASKITELWKNRAI